MPTIPHNTSSSDVIHTAHFHFLDSHGRVLLLRGVNLSGASKAPLGQLSHEIDHFWEGGESGDENFIGRPLRLEDGSADVHLARLKGWGFDLLRMPFTWEALEHDRPGKYDYEFMDYIVRVLDKCREYGFKVYMDPHQDTWSRFSGGSGAPYWTLPACGINPRNLTSTQSAIIHSEYPYAHSPDPSSIPAMIWSTNYGRLLSQTIFTLFFAGKDFAPKCLIDGVNIQDWLQGKYLAACGELAKRLSSWEGGKLLDSVVIGWDSINEPFEGLVGWEDLNLNPTRQGSTLKKGTHPTPAQSFRLGMGQAQTVDNYKFGSLGPQRDGTVTIDPKGFKIWGTAEELGELEDGTHPRWGWKRDVASWELGQCTWAQHGVWDVETGFVLRPDYFNYRPVPVNDTVDQEEVEFLTDYWKPHWLAYSSVIRQHHREAIVLVQPPVFAPPPPFTLEETKGRCAYSPHYYDGLTLVSRHWNWFNADALGLMRGKYRNTMAAVKIGEGMIRKSLRQQIGYLLDDVDVLGREGSERPGCEVPSLEARWYPTVIGEIGTPFDMDDKRSYGYSSGGKYLGDYSQQEKALDASLNACDGERACNWTVWTYVGDDHSHEWGDGWNLEDLSLWSLGDLVEKPEEKEKDIRKIVKETEPTKEDMQMNLDPSADTLLGNDGAKTGACPSSTTLLSSSSRSISPNRKDTQTVGQHQYINIRGFNTNPYIFLTNGARAYRAFARPRPVKVVGEPLDVEFDLAKGVFKVVVLVKKADVVGLGPRNGDSLDEEEERRATEVYLPLVHYAHKGVVDDAFRIWRDGEPEKEDEAVKANGVNTPAEIELETETNTVVDVDAISLEVNEEARSKAQISSEAPCQIPDMYRLVYPSPGDPDIVPLVDADIRVSHGRFKVVGQRLLWWYEEDVLGDELRVEMEVKRRGGPLKVVDWRRVGNVDTKEMDIVEREKGCCEKLCDEDGTCVIA